jgi:hypothetical protein
MEGLPVTRDQSEADSNVTDPGTFFTMKNGAMAEISGFVMRVSTAQSAEIRASVYKTGQLHSCR